MRIRHVSIAAAVSLLAPALVVVSPGVFDAAAEPAPVATKDTDVALVAPDKTAGDGDQVEDKDLHLAKSQAAAADLSPAAKTAPSVIELSPETPVPADLTVMGVTWQAGTAPDTVVQYRIRTAAGWGEWQAVDSDSEAGDAEAMAAGARAGSDPVVVTGATHAQVRVLGASGQKPADARLSLIDPQTTAADAKVGTVAPGSAAAAAQKPWINSRAAWGADESIRGKAPSYGRVDGVVVHHTAGTNNYTQAQVPAIMRGIYAFHAKDRGWNDIGYNFLVDKWGRVWEGRAGGADRAVIGAHATGTNSTTMGISVMGDYTKTSVSDAAMDAITRTIAWKAGVHGFDPNGRQTLLGKNMPAIVGHRDVGQTTCPGPSIYSKLGTVRTRAASLARGATRPATTPAGAAPAPKPAASPRGLTPDHLLMRGSSNVLFASSFTGSDVTFAKRVHGGNFAAYTTVIAAGDMSGDGLGDALGRTRDGRLFLFKGKADGTLAAGVQSGTGWGAMRSLSAGADFSGDRIPDLTALDNRGGLWLYKGNGKGGFQRKQQIGTGWGAFTQVMNIGDWNGDGRGDVVGVRKDGRAFLYTGNGKGGFASSAIALSGNFKAFTSVTPMVNRKAFIGVDSAGRGHVVKRNGATGTSVTKATPNFRGLTVFGR